MQMRANTFRKEDLEPFQEHILVLLKSVKSGSSPRLEEAITLDICSLTRESSITRHLLSARATLMRRMLPSQTGCLLGAKAKLTTLWPGSLRGSTPTKMKTRSTMRTAKTT
ncbi:hypothetical protein BX616_008198, partial [Lobosporangium transversale]